MENKNKSSYNDWVHKFGIWSGFAISAIMMLFPILSSIVYGIWPDWVAITPPIISSIAWLAPYWISQTLGFVQSMGPAALYSSYVTGNTTNLKLPAIMATQSICNVEPCSEAAHCVGMLAAGASALCVMLILLIGVCFSNLVKPLVTNPTFAPAFKYAVSALFGAVVATNVNSWKKVGYCIAPFIVTWFFCYHTHVKSSWYMLYAIGISMIVGRIVYLVQKKKASAAD